MVSAQPSFISFCQLARKQKSFYGSMTGQRRQRLTKLLALKRDASESPADIKIFKRYSHFTTCCGPHIPITQKLAFRMSLHTLAVWCPQSSLHYVLCSWTSIIKSTRKCASLCVFLFIINMGKSRHFLVDTVTVHLLFSRPLKCMQRSGN